MQTQARILKGPLRQPPNAEDSLQQPNQPILRVNCTQLVGMTLGFGCVAGSPVQPGQRAEQRNPFGIAAQGDKRQQQNSNLDSLGFRPRFNTEQDFSMSRVREWSRTPLSSPSFQL